MTRKALNEMKEIVKELNIKNEHHGVKYGMEIVHFGRNKYSVDLSYERIFYGTDFKTILRFMERNDLGPYSLFFGVCNNTPYMSIQ